MGDQLESYLNSWATGKENYWEVTKLWDTPVWFLADVSIEFATSGLGGGFKFSVAG
jgi:hypothetical protein